MSAVLIVPTEALIEEFPAQVAAQLRSEFKPRVDAIVLRLRSAPPAEGTVEEAQALMDLMKVFWELGSKAGPALMEKALNAAQQKGLEGLIRRELSESALERKLALRLLEKACEALGQVLVSLAPLLPDLSKLRPEQLDASELAGSPMLLLFRFEADLIVAMESLDAPLGEFTALVRRCSARTLELQKWAAEARADLIDLRMRERSKNAWVDWDDDDLRDELAPWPQ